MPTTERTDLPETQDESGVVSHLRWVEWSWVHVRLLGEDDAGPWTDEDPDRSSTTGWPSRWR